MPRVYVFARDHINTDDLAGLQRFLLAEDPAEQGLAAAA